LYVLQCVRVFFNFVISLYYAFAFSLVKLSKNFYRLSCILNQSQSYQLFLFYKNFLWVFLNKRFYQLVFLLIKVAILSLNTITHTIGAAGVGAQAVKVFGEAYFGIISAVLTFLILIFTEIIPKTIGVTYWKNLAKVSYFTIKSMIFITYPLIILSSAITKVFSKQKNEQTTSREEIAALASIGTDEGLFSDKENLIIQNIIKLKNVKVTEIMTPRVVVVVADENLTLHDFLKNKAYLKFSRIPVYSETDENISGFVLRQEVFEKLAEGKQNLKLKKIKREILIVPNTMELFSLWEKMLKKKEHIVLIVDEYGGLDGM